MAINIADTIDKSCSILQSGGIILYPTDTIWGLGADIFSEKATNNIFELKKRDKSKPLIILVSSIEMLKEYAKNVHPRIETLLFYHERPVTVIHQARKIVPDWIKTEMGTVGIRVCTDPYCKALIEKFGKPISSTSANISGNPIPTKFDEISSEIIVGADYIAKPHPLNKKMDKASVVVRYDDEGELFVLRG